MCGSNKETTQSIPIELLILILHKFEFQDRSSIFSFENFGQLKFNLFFNSFNWPDTLYNYESIDSSVLNSSQVLPDIIFIYLIAL